MTPDELLRQAKVSGKDYLECSSSYLVRDEMFTHTFDNCIRLAEIMQKDFNFMMKYQTEERFCDILRSISDSLESIAKSLKGEEDDD